MNELSLESLAKRVEALEKAGPKSGTASRQRLANVVGMFKDSEFMRHRRECQEPKLSAKRRARIRGMILIDTDHVSFLKFPESAGKQFIARPNRLPTQKRSQSQLSHEERMRWLAMIAKERHASASHRLSRVRWCRVLSGICHFAVRRSRGTSLMICTHVMGRWT